MICVSFIILLLLASCSVGGFALLPAKLSDLLSPHLASARQVVDVPTPQLTADNAGEQWSATVQALILSCAGLCKYLMDAHPEQDDETDC